MQVPRFVGDKEGGFTVGELLGEGSMGAVYAGVGANGGRAAIKFLHPHLAQIPEVLERFLREAAAVGRVRSPFIAPVLLAGRTRGRHWIAYRRLEGETLDARLKRVGVLPRSVLGPFVEHLLRGLEAAHDVGVLHRDVKPSNIFLERLESPPSERASILDFGISKYVPVPGSDSTSPPSLTSTAQTLGTVSYMAPEQVDGAKRVDGRADLFAAAMLAFEAATGRLPFEGASSVAIMTAKLNGWQSSLESVTETPWPGVLEAFFARALARERDDRFPTASAMRVAWLDVTGTDSWPNPERLRARLAEDARRASARAQPTALDRASGR